MAGGVVDGGPAKRAHLYEHKFTHYFAFTCFVGALGGSLFGYDLGVSGGVTSMDDFLVKFFPDVYKRKHEHLKETDYCKYDNQLLTLFTSSLYFSALVMTFFASYLTRKKGRKASIIAGGLSFLAGAILNAAAENITMLIIGRILLGGGIGFGNQAVPLYLSEMAPAKTRGAVNQLFQFTTCFGILVANLINYFTDKMHPNGWRVSLGLAAIPATLMLLGGIFCAETPNSLVEQGRFDEARKVLERVRGTKNVDAEYQDLVEASEEAQIATAVALAVDFGDGKELSKGVSYFLVIVLFLFVLAYGRSWGPLGWLVPSELFPLEIRSAAQSIVVCVNMIFTALVAQLFLVSLCHLKYGIFLLFAALIVIMSLFIFFLLPETKQVPIEEIYLLFENHWFWKSIVGQRDQHQVKAAQV
ncbi:hypothetical protein PIB30_011643 [Stylosanthes scabra]|uniref:Major facilitator superfamily (MFS) profile domain-containing protein n=1 Tax=Stylosanthes scabra TaxID=79078 RepID=A0ABU6W3Y8_9FABA|nr:hypothetical protein [Stylosanthes scabra]